MVRNRSNMSIKNNAESIDLPTVSSESHMIAFEEVPLTALSKKSMRRLSHLLNSKKILRSEEGYERDWRGLACLAQQKCLCDENTIGLEDPITKVIQMWCTNNPKTATFAFLEKFLGIIDRWDAADDIYENLVEDTKTFQAKQKHSLGFKLEENVFEMHCFNSDFGNGSDPDILTLADVMRAQKGLSPQIYDAFVLYADADLNYASEMLTKLEDNPEYGFKLCMKDRDLLAGVQFEHVALTQLIEERCKHLIVILTEEFLKSPENKFLVNYTQALQIQYRTRKIIPLLYEDNLNIPRTLKMYTHLRYKSGTASLFNFWSKLANSIKNVNAITDVASLNRNPTYSSSTQKNRTSNREESNLNKSSLRNEIPSINIIPPEDNEKSKIEEKDRVLLNDGVNLRNAHSTGQLHTSNRANNTVSMTDLSTTSTYINIKKKKKWSTKVLKRVFSGRNCKLQEA